MEQVILSFHSKVDIQDDSCL